MSSLSDAYDARDGRDRRRLALGTGLLLAGTLVAVPGFVRVLTDLLVAAGVARLPALKGAFAVGGLALPLTFVVLLSRLPADGRLRAASAGGTALATIGVALFWVTVEPAALATVGGIPATVLAVYGLGAAVTMGCPAAVAARAAVETGATAGSGIAVESTDTAFFEADDPGASDPRAGGVPADGGTEEDDLEFLLDEDDDQDDPGSGPPRR